MNNLKFGSKCNNLTVLAETIKISRKNIEYKPCTSVIVNKNFASSNLPLFLTFFFLFVCLFWDHVQRWSEARPGSALTGHSQQCPEDHMVMRNKPMCKAFTPAQLTIRPQIILVILIWRQRFLIKSYNFILSCLKKQSMKSSLEIDTDRGWHL